jgi:hypothetical protein
METITNSRLDCASDVLLSDDLFNKLGRYNVVCMLLNCTVLIWEWGFVIENADVVRFALMQYSGDQILQEVKCICRIAISRADAPDLHGV